MFINSLLARIKTVVDIVSAASMCEFESRCAMLNVVVPALCELSGRKQPGRKEMNTPYCTGVTLTDRGSLQLALSDRLQSHLEHTMANVR